MMTTKPFNIPKSLIVDAWKIVKSNAGSSGIDEETTAMYEADLKNNLYKLWNRMSSGSYFPPAVKAVSIPKKNGGKRMLGIPTVTDRIAQTAVKLIFEPKVEPCFHKDSYGYRPGKSALDAIGVTRVRCWQYEWVLEYDIKGLFDNIDHELLMKAVRKHTNEKWLLLYIERWLKVPMQQTNGELIERTCGTPQGGIVSPILANLFLHYVHDVWLSKNKPDNSWCRYADDGLIHCKSEAEAEEMLRVLDTRFMECNLQLHPDKTKIIYCQNRKSKTKSKNTQFDFLGYTFRPRWVKNRYDRVSVGFTPAVSKLSLNAMRAKIRKMNIRNRTDLNLNQIADLCNPMLRGWLNYYGCYNRSSLDALWNHFNCTIIAWAQKKYKKLRKSKNKAVKFLKAIFAREPKLFVHWKMV